MEFDDTLLFHVFLWWCCVVVFGLLNSHGVNDDLIDGVVDSLGSTL